MDPTQKINAQTGTPEPASPDIQIPGYTIMRELGHGGMAHVYLAIQESFGREVALKILSPHLADDDQFSKRFLREARIVSQLNHPNIVTVYDAGKHGKHHYMSMEYIPGKDLKALKDSISRENAVRIVKDVARALDFAGAKGIVHRDVKPENIMIHKGDNRVVLMDFGIAHGDDVTQGMTQTGKAIGTPHFMSPEQTKGLKVDHRSDIYSLGVVLFQLLSGHLPFDADSAVAVGIKHLTAPIPLLPGGLEIFQPIINHCLSKQPQHRYQKAAELIAALDKISDKQLSDIKTKASDFKKAGVDHHAKTQVSDAVIRKKRKVPNIVFPSNHKTSLNENLEEKNTHSNRRRNLLFLLLITTLIWAGNEKQKELTQFWGYKALPKIAQEFPDLFPKSYLQYWSDKEKSKTTPTLATTSVTTTPASIKDNQAQPPLTTSVKDAQLTTSDTAIQQSQPAKTEPTIDGRIFLLKEGLDNAPENATELAALYKTMLSEPEQKSIAQNGLKALRDWYLQQISLAFATEDAVVARKLIEQMKQSFPRATKTQRFIRLEKKVTFLERINNHFIQAEKYFNAGALSKPLNKNALNEIGKVLTLSPKNEDAKIFINKIAQAYIDKSTQLHNQGSIHNAILMIEEGIAALNTNTALIQKRKDLKAQIKHNKVVSSLFAQAKKYEASNQLIKPQAYNAYDLYQEILKKENANLQAKAGLKSIHQKQAKNIIVMIQNDQLNKARLYLQAAIQRYGRTPLLAKVQLKLNDAINSTLPRIETIQISSAPVNRLQLTNPGANTNEVLIPLNTLYVGFNFINFSPKTTWLDVALSNKKTNYVIAQKPVVVSNQFGESFFEINLPNKELAAGNYKIELKLDNKILKAKSFLVRSK